MLATLIATNSKQRKYKLKVPLRLNSVAMIRLRGWSPPLN